MSEGRKKVTVVVINYNGANDLEETLAAIRKLDYSHISEVAVIDNCSTDSSLKLLADTFSWVRTVAFSENRGPNPARNWALENTDTELLLIMDNDIIMASDALSLMVAALEQDQSAGAVSAQIRFADDPSVIQYNGCHIHYAGEAVINRADSHVSAEAGALSAGCVLVDRNKALHTGRFDEDFFFGWEDGDFFYRMRIAGFHCLVHAGAKVYHKKEKRGMRRIALQVRNRWWFMIKNYNTRTLIIALPMILLYQLAVCFFMILKGRGREFFHGMFLVCSGLGNLRDKRRQVKEIRVKRDRDLLTGYGFRALSDERGSLLVRTADALLGGLFSGYWFLFSWMMD